MSTTNINICIMQLQIICPVINICTIISDTSAWMLHQTDTILNIYDSLFTKNTNNSQWRSSEDICRQKIIFIITTGLRWALLTPQHWAHSRNRPRPSFFRPWPWATDEKKKGVLYFDCDFSAWCNSEKIIKIVAIGCHILKLKCTSAPPGH